MIKPIVNIAKIIDAYDAVICGFNGVIHNGRIFFPEAVEVLVKLYQSGKKIALLSNMSCRVEDLVRKLHHAGVSPLLFTTVVTAGELLHYYLIKSSSSLGHNYYNLGEKNDVSAFAETQYVEVSDLAQADFLYVGKLPIKQNIESYLEDLNQAVSLGLPLVCSGNDTSILFDNDVYIASGVVAEQYAALGGNIITIGKPDYKVINYVCEALNIKDSKRILIIGDSMSVDIKAATVANLSSCLISKGIHVNSLGEGYIPDVTKTRELGNMINVYPDYVISQLRW